MLDMDKVPHLHADFFYKAQPFPQDGRKGVRKCCRRVVCIGINDNIADDRRANSVNAKGVVERH
jgi:hypothetical protein